VKVLYRVLAGAAAVGLFFVGLYFSEKGFKYIQDFRKLERIPLTTILGSAGGETQLNGRAEKYQDLLTAPKTKTRTLYYQYLKEEEYKDSDGDTRWRTVRNERDTTLFNLTDSTGTALIDNGGGVVGIDWSVATKFRKQEGDYRYTEWRIDPGDRVTVFGWLNIDEQQPIMTFHNQGDYLPIISSFDADSQRAEMGSTAVFRLWFGVSAFVVMCFAIVYCLRMHKVLVFFSLVAFSTSCLLVYYGYQSLQVEVDDGHRRAMTQQQRTETLLAALFSNYDLTFPGLQQAFDLSDQEYINIDEWTKYRIDSLRLASYQVRDRYYKELQRFPYNLYVTIAKIEQVPQVVLPEVLQKKADQQSAAYTPTRLSSQAIWVMIGVALVMLAAWVGFRMIRVKRMQENIVASKVGGVAYGMAETNGKLRPVKDSSQFVGPLSGEDCCWYRYIVKEKRGSGKNSKWVEIERKEEEQPFFCQDNSGAIYIEPEGAEYITQHRYRERRGNRIYTEQHIKPDDQLYVFAKARQGGEHGEMLVMADDEKLPFIIANLSEEEVKFVKGSKGLMLLSLATVILFLCGFWIGGSNGNFSAVDFLLASLIAPAMGFLMMIMFMYNDLIFLRERCERNWANIQVSLKKRFDLLPQLEKVVEKYLSHENQLQKKLTAMRRVQSIVDEQKEVDAYLKYEADFIDGFRVSLEDYPDLKGNTVVEDFHSRIVMLENEIGFMRDGFNDAVTQYNTRLSLFPDVILARLFHFKSKSLLRYEGEAHKLHKVEFEPA